jgi:hypothetical protein
MRKLGGNFGRDEEARTANIGLAIWRLKCFYETFVQGSTAVILLNFCAKNPPHRQAENRYRSFYGDILAFDRLKYK